MNMRVKKFYIIAFCLLWLAISQTDKLKAEVLDKIVAVVNEDIILLSDFKQELNNYRESATAAGSGYNANPKEIETNVLSGLIEEKLLDQQAETAGVSVDEEEIDRFIDRIKKSSNIDTDTLENVLKQQYGMTISQYRQKIKEKLEREKFLVINIRSKIVVTKEEVEDRYLENIKQYQGKLKYRLRRIIKKVPENLNKAEKIRIRSDMEKTLQSLKGEKSIEKIESLTEDIGVFDYELLSDEIKDALHDLKRGMFSDIIETNFGFQIFFIQDIIESEGKSLDDAFSEIEDKIFDEKANKKLNSWIKELRQKSYIKIIG